MKMIPLEKQSKREQRKFHANKRGSWNGIKPTLESWKVEKCMIETELNKQIVGMPSSESAPLRLIVS